MSLIILFLAVIVTTIIFLATLAFIAIAAYFLITFVEWTFDKIDKLNK